MFWQWGATLRWSSRIKEYKSKHAIKVFGLVYLFIHSVTYVTLKLYSILSCSGWNHWSYHPATRVAATISQFRKGVKGIRACEIGLTYNDSK